MIEKVLFLDIDGVLNIETSVQYTPILPECIERLNRVVKETSCEVVVSSTWRLGSTLILLDKLFKEAGYTGSFLSVTPSFAKRTRGDEIRAWLATHPTENFAIVDDNDDMGNLFPYLVKTCDDEGLQDHHADKLIYFLNSTLEQRKLIDLYKNGAMTTKEFHQAANAFKIEQSVLKYMCPEIEHNARTD